MGVKPGDTEADLARAFRQRMLSCHPDREGGDEGEAAKLSAIYDSFKRMLVPCPDGVKRLRPPKTSREIHSWPGAPPIRVVIVGGPGVSVSFSTTTTGQYTPTGRPW